MQSLILLAMCVGVLGGEPNQPVPQVELFQKQVATLEADVSRLRKSLGRTRREVVRLKKENRQLRAICRRARIRLPRNLDVMEPPQNKATTKPKPPILGRDMTIKKIGQVGILERTHILQIRDVNNALIEIPTEWKADPVYYGIAVSPRPLISTKTMVVWLSNYDVSNMADGQEVPTMIAEVIETKTYTNTRGANKTVFVLEPVKQGKPPAADLPHKRG